MISNFQQSIQLLREKSANTIDLGNSFERLVKIFLENDATQTQQYEKVWHYADWARDREGYSRRDIGIDLVAKIREQESFCAIQCKCYDAGNCITKEHLDSFVSASASKDFSRLLLIDTSTAGIAPNARQVLDNLEKEYLRIQISELENSRIDWLTYVREDRVRLRNKHSPFDHQKQALAAAKEGFETGDRGKIIMACGTGKTYASLLIAEVLAGAGKLVLYMVPSLSLMSQTIREWKNDATVDFTAFSACSDKKVGNRNKHDEIIVSLHDLAFPATTDARGLAEQVKKAPSDKLTVVFSTYHSIDVILQSQKDYGMKKFDLIICDEAHRTTGATLVGEDESNFVKIHSNENVGGEKRLYMTATPRIYGERAKAKADDDNVALASMDDESTYGPLFFHRGFGWAVENNLLTDYKVVVLAVDEGVVSTNVHTRLVEGAELKLDDATKIVGCYKALAKVGFKESEGLDIDSLKPMKRALAFCQNIKLSQLLADEFAQVVAEYNSKESTEAAPSNLTVVVRHVDGEFDADLRNERLNWLKAEPDENTCHVLSNVRCMAEGVDVPALDAVIFMHPRKSQIDVVQSVGRVMRKSTTKELGYVIIPITVAPGVSPEKALNDNEKYRVVWQILNALRSHDERFDSTINKLGLGEDVSDRIEIVGIGAREELDATTAVVDDIKAKKRESGARDELNESADREPATEEGGQIPFVLADLSKAIKAKIVERCGTRDYWENWAKDIAKIAQAHITRIKSIVFNEGTPEREVFVEFLAEIRDDLNPSITETEAVEMLAQHLVTKPVFETLFKDHEFTSENPVSKAMQSVLIALQTHKLEKESESLHKFYASVKRRAEGIVTSTGRQTLVLELYDRFFSYAFKSMTERLGIVYTPVEVVDFIVRSVEDVLNSEFKKSVSDKSVHVLDPFVGTGTFITRLLQSQIVRDDDLLRKYQSEIHANELVLLAYYIASINIESVYQERAKDHSYLPFDGIVLTDTYQLYEEGNDMIASLLSDNSRRRKNQKERTITVIVGNPPYSAGQRAANDDAANIAYPNLDTRIARTYVEKSTATRQAALYDSYIRAFRLASDRIGEEGVVAFVTGAGWIEGNATDGMRKCLAEEFSKIYVFHLRGNQRTSGETSRREGGKIFGAGSRSPIAITILVRKKDIPSKAEIFFCDIGDYFSREEKLAIVKHYGSIDGIAKEQKWVQLTPDANNDWINQGDAAFDGFMALGDKKQKRAAAFANYSLGVVTNRDAWCYNFSRRSLEDNIKKTIDFYNSETMRYKATGAVVPVDRVVTRDSTKTSWTRSLLSQAGRGKTLIYDDNSVRTSLYRPFTKMMLYFSPELNEVQYQIPNIFPTKHQQNVVIAVTGIGSKRFSCLLVDSVPDLQLMFNGQCFPFHLYEHLEDKEDLLSVPSGVSEFRLTNGISAQGLLGYQEAYPTAPVSREDVFYYIYGLLHSVEYRDRFENNLSKQVPRIPIVKRYEDFKAFSEAGRRLGDLHVNYESVPAHAVAYKQGDLQLSVVNDPKTFYRVQKMKYGGTRGKTDKSTVIYNHNITMKSIPLEAYEYVVNGKSALDWVIERQCVKTDKDSKIVNDANDYANEAMVNPAYPLELFQRVITVSLETMKIVGSLPKLEIGM